MQQGTQRGRQGCLSAAEGSWRRRGQSCSRRPAESRVSSPAARNHLPYSVKNSLHFISKFGTPFFLASCCRSFRTCWSIDWKLIYSQRKKKNNPARLPSRFGALDWTWRMRSSAASVRFLGALSSSKQFSLIKQVSRKSMKVFNLMKKALSVANCFQAQASCWKLPSWFHDCFTVLPILPYFISLPSTGSWNLKCCRLADNTTIIVNILSIKSIAAQWRDIMDEDKICSSFVGPLQWVTPMDVTYRLAINHWVALATRYT